MKKILYYLSAFLWLPILWAVATVYVTTKAVELLFSAINAGFEKGASWIDQNIFKR